MKTVTHNFYCMKGVTMELKRYGSEQERISWKKPAQVEHFMSLLMKICFPNIYLLIFL